MSMNMYYILKGKKAVPVESVEWAQWSESSDRRVAREYVGNREVSTVFLGINHQFGSGPPKLFETLVFAEGDDKWDGYMERYSTWEEAEEGHRNIVECIHRNIVECIKGGEGPE